MSLGHYEGREFALVAAARFRCGLYALYEFLDFGNWSQPCEGLVGLGDSVEVRLWVGQSFQARVQLYQGCCGCF